MTTAKKLKKQIRARKARTGESYAAARRHVVKSLADERDKRTKAAAKKARTAKATGTVTEARVIEKTGHGFDHWFAILDRFSAPSKGHTASAKHLREEHGMSAWYCQSVTVAYERARGLRDVNQACDGGFQFSVSRVLPVPLEEALPALSRAAGRAKWLPGDDCAEQVDAALRDKRFRKTPSGSVAVRFKTAGATVEMRLHEDKPGRSKVWMQASKLADAAAVETQRAAWRALLDAYRNHLR